jgi:hypothetical protein
MRLIKALGVSAPAAVQTGAGDNVDSATCVRAFNNTTTNYLVTIETVGDVLIGSFWMAGGAEAFIEKDPTDQIFAANAGVFLTKVAFR